jgi:hypothetical protein
MSEIQKVREELLNLLFALNDGITKINKAIDELKKDFLYLEKEVRENKRSLQSNWEILKMCTTNTERLVKWMGRVKDEGLENSFKE